MKKDLKEEFEKNKRSVKYLIDNKKNNFNDKIATIKATNIVDKKRFQSAFKKLLDT